MRRRSPELLVLLALAAVAVTLGLISAGGNAAPQSRGEQVQQVASQLHCPICKDLSVADSPAPLAQQMRAQIDQQLAAGRSPDEIRAGFIASYGDSVLMSPPRHGLANTAYYLPFVVVIGGALVAFQLLRRWRRAGAAEADDEPPPLTAAQRLALRRAVEQLREEEG